MDDKKLAIDINNLVVEYRTLDGVVHAVNGLDLKFETGKTLGLVGETGAGKTTTGLSIMRLVQEPQGVIVNGSIIFNGEDLLKKTEKQMEKLRGRHISMIFQDPMSSLNAVLTVEDQIAETLELHENLGKEEATAKAQDMLEMVGIPRSRGKEYPHQFSGGMKQRVVIALALACNPQFIIADEPTTALDVTIQAQVLEMIKDLRKKFNTSMLMITHDLGIVAEICDEVSIIYAGRVIEHGTLEDIFDHDLHPYTQGLFNSLPNLEDIKAKLKPIKGLMPDPTDLPKGCAFYPRCDYVMDICKTQKPSRLYRNENHYVECHIYTKENIHESKVR
jgi:peptide/nickel transport system ATP-binding protein